MKKYLINGTTFLAVWLIFGATVFSQGRPILGGYKPAKTDEARVVAAAEFAVGAQAEKNPEQEGLMLDSVDKAETQVVAGTNFRLCLTVRIEDETQQIETVVFQNLKQEYALKSWTVKECAEKKSSSDEEDTAQLISVGYAPKSQTKTPNCFGNQLSLSETEAEADIGGKQYARFLLTNISKKVCTSDRLSDSQFAERQRTTDAARQG